MTRDALRERLQTLTDAQKFDVFMFLIGTNPVAVEKAMRKAEVL